jgi:import inner membrane translocase subunit TIM44
MRSVGRVFTWLNAENDMARVTKSIKEIDLDFTLETFRRELKEYIIPEITEGWVAADREMMKPWLGEAVSEKKRGS